jgi:hypothetical protein
MITLLCFLWGGHSAVWACAPAWSPVLRVQVIALPGADRRFREGLGTHGGDRSSIVWNVGLAVQRRSCIPGSPRVMVPREPWEDGLAVDDPVGDALADLKAEALAEIPWEVAR